MKKTTIYIPEDLAKSVTVAAKRQGSSEAAIIREAISNYVATLDRPWPKSIGLIEDGTIDSTNIKAWIRGKLETVITLDTSAVVALIDRRDAPHHSAVAAVRTESGPIFVPSMIMAEISWLVESRAGHYVLDSFLSDIESGAYHLDTEVNDIPRIRQLTNRYIDLPLGFSDAAVIACAERNGNRVLSFDRRHFELVARDTRLVLLPKTFT